MTEQRPRGELGVTARVGAASPWRSVDADDDEDCGRACDMLR